MKSKAELRAELEAFYAQSGINRMPRAEIASVEEIKAYQPNAFSMNFRGTRSWSRKGNKYYS